MTFYKSRQINPGAEAEVPLLKKWAGDKSFEKILTGPFRSRCNYGPRGLGPKEAFFNGEKINQNNEMLGLLPACD